MLISQKKSLVSVVLFTRCYQCIVVIVLHAHQYLILCLTLSNPTPRFFSLLCFIEKVSPVAQAVFEFLIPPGSASQVLGL